MIREARRCTCVLAVVALFLGAREVRAIGGTISPPTSNTVSRGADAGGVATSNGYTIPPSVPLTHADPTSRDRVVLRLVRVELRPGVHTRLVAGPDALEPGTVVLDVTPRADASPRTAWVAIPSWR